MRDVSPVAEASLTSKKRSASTTPLHDTDHAGRIPGRGGVADLEEKIGIDHSERLHDVVVNEIGAAQRDGLIEDRQGIAKRTVSFARDQHKRRFVGRYPFLVTDALQP
jgi:hypothetical protein